MNKRYDDCNLTGAYGSEKDHPERCEHKMLCVECVQLKLKNREAFPLGPRKYRACSDCLNRMFLDMWDTTLAAIDWKSVEAEHNLKQRK